MKVHVLADGHAVARHAAALVAARARSVLAHRPRFVMAMSGGTTPWAMLRAFAEEDVPWELTHIVQVDERVAPTDHHDRNLRHLRDSLSSRGQRLPLHIHPMPVEADDLSAGASEYARTLRVLAGTPARLDLVHLGLGSDGHTASLVPGDPVLGVDDIDVSMTSEYQGRRRMTLTYPILNRARQLLWLVVGDAKAGMLKRLVDGDHGIPAGRIRRARAVVLADRAAARAVERLAD